MLVSSLLFSVIVLAMVVQVGVEAEILKLWPPPPPHTHTHTLYINVHNTVYYGHQGAAIMPGIETAARMHDPLVSLSLTKFAIACTGAAVLTTHFKIGCLLVHNIPPTPPPPPPPPAKKNPICVPAVLVYIQLERTSNYFQMFIHSDLQCVNSPRL